MRTAPTLVLSALALLLAGPAPSAGVATQGAHPACCGLYPGASEPLVLALDEGEPPSLLDVARSYGELTGNHLVVDEALAARLAATPTGLLRPVTVPAPEVQSFFEELCTSHGFAIAPLRRDPPRLLRLLPLEGGRGATHDLRRSAVFVAEEDLPHLAKHPATLVTTSLHLPSSDVRQLAASMRALVTSSDAQSILPAGASHDLVLSGFGAEVAGLARLLQEVDRASTARQAQREEPELRVLRLRNAEAYEVADMLRGVFPPEPAPAEGSAPSRGPRFVVDQRLNAVVVRARPPELVRIEALVAELDRRAEREG